MSAKGNLSTGSRILSQPDLVGSPALVVGLITACAGAAATLAAAAVSTIPSMIGAPVKVQGVLQNGSFWRAVPVNGCNKPVWGNWQSPPSTVSTYADTAEDVLLTLINQYVKEPERGEVGSEEFFADYYQQIDTIARDMTAEKVDIEPFTLGGKTFPRSVAIFELDPGAQFQGGLQAPAYQLTQSDRWVIALELRVVVGRQYRAAGAIGTRRWLDSLDYTGKGSDVLNFIDSSRTIDGVVASTLSRGTRQEVTFPARYRLKAPGNVVVDVTSNLTLGLTAGKSVKFELGQEIIDVETVS